MVYRGHSRNKGLCYEGFEGSQHPLLRVYGGTCPQPPPDLRLKGVQEEVQLWSKCSSFMFKVHRGPKNGWPGSTPAPWMRPCIGLRRAQIVLRSSTAFCCWRGHISVLLVSLYRSRIFMFGLRRGDIVTIPQSLVDYVQNCCWLFEDV